MSQEPGTAKVKHIIAIASGKGGVGKSTVSTNLAMALKKSGHKVGLLDADLYGPSQSTLLGTTRPPESQDGMILPVEQLGIKFISMGVMNQKGGAVIMRAPMAIRAITQFLGGVLWGDLDYLLIDLPPGTGDIQLTMAQQARLTGAVIVTTPQKVAVEIASKGLEMFQQVNVPILGIVENMSGFACPKCDEVTPIFKSGGGQGLASDLKLPYLGGIPLDPAIIRASDEGVPVVEADPESTPAKTFLKVADQLIDSIQKNSKNTESVEPRNVEVNPENGKLKVNWVDGQDNEYSAFDLRLKCPCAKCVDEGNGKVLITPDQIAKDIKVMKVSGVGRYGLSVQFSDGHGTGIYKYKVLREL